MGSPPLGPSSASSSPPRGGAVSEALWESRLQELLEFRCRHRPNTKRAKLWRQSDRGACGDRHGHSQIPQTESLGMWVRKQRHCAQRGQLCAGRRACLIAAGLELDPLGRDWEERFFALLLHMQVRILCWVPCDSLLLAAAQLHTFQRCLVALRRKELPMTLRSSRRTETKHKSKPCLAGARGLQPIADGTRRGWGAWALGSCAARTGKEREDAPRATSTSRRGGEPAVKRAGPGRVREAMLTRETPQVGFIWDRVEAEWEDGFRAFERFVSHPSAHPKTKGGGLVRCSNGFCLWKRLRLI